MPALGQDPQTGGMRSPAAPMSFDKKMSVGLATQKGLAQQYAAAEIREDVDELRKAVQQNSWALSFIDCKLLIADSPEGRSRRRFTEPCCRASASAPGLVALAAPGRRPRTASGALTATGACLSAQDLRPAASTTGARQLQQYGSVQRADAMSRRARSATGGGRRQLAATM
mmetsp:Transcript_123283/g.356215  ORF Transcript_123283/g.356215 Transcript_123283/m.356215 type:complete len:171 (-) Transcript_123283:71-583(-)